jgi:hypothetical protein
MSAPPVLLILVQSHRDVKANLTQYDLTHMFLPFSLYLPSPPQEHKMHILVVFVLVM